MGLTFISVCMLTNSLLLNIIVNGTRNAARQDDFLDTGLRRLTYNVEGSFKCTLLYGQHEAAVIGMC